MEDWLKKLASFILSNFWLVFVFLVIFGKKKKYRQVNRNQAADKLKNMVNLFNGSDFQEILKNKNIVINNSLAKRFKIPQGIIGGKTIQSNWQAGQPTPFVFSKAETKEAKSRRHKERQRNISRRAGLSGLNPRQRYLQVALNGSLSDSLKIISRIPLSERILIEAGTPLIKTSGMDAIRSIKTAIEARTFFSGSKQAYIVADIKTADLGEREALMAKRAGASAVTCLGVAPIETINAFISACQKHQLDSMIDMMNVENPSVILKKLKSQPQAVIIHRGVDETDNDKSKLIPYYQINQVKGVSKTMVSVAGGDSISEIRSAVFNGANIVVLWKAFYRFGSETETLVKEFLKEIR